MGSPEKVTVTVLQSELERIDYLRRKIWVMRKELKSLEEEVRDLLVAGAEKEKGRFEARLDPIKGCQKPRLAVIEHPPLPSSWSG